jgi:hypothetical protein
MTEDMLYIHDPRRIDPEWRECYLGDGFVRRLYGPLDKGMFIELLFLANMQLPDVVQCRCWHKNRQEDE